MEPVRLGIIGCGVIGNHHAKSASESPDISLMAVADLREDVRNEIAKTYNVSKVYNDGKELIANPDIEAVVLAMPTYLRFDLALEAFEKGKHVLTEKPVAMNIDEVKKLIASRGKLIAGCCSSRYCFPESTKILTDFIAQGHLGNIRSIFVRAFSPARKKPDTSPPEWRLKRSLNGGGFLVNWGCYDLNYFLNITGWRLKPELVLAQTWTIADRLISHIPAGSDAETHYMAFIRCTDGAAIFMERGEYMPVQNKAIWQIVGDNGCLDLHMIPEKQKKIIFNKTDKNNGFTTDTIWEGDDDSSILHRGPVHDFANAIREGRQPKTSLEQSLIIQKITDAIYTSAREGQAVKV